MAVFPMAAETVLRSTYMDDSMDSVMNEEDGIDLHRQLSQLLTQAGMHARKWLSNSSTVLKEIPLQDRKTEVDLDTDYLPSSKTLGVWWSADQDVFTFKENAPSDEMKYTKRNFLKKIATFFDPIGFLAPFTIRAKLLLQEMWMAGLDWDEELSEPLINSARTWFSELSDLKHVRIPRCLIVKGKQIDNLCHRNGFWRRIITQQYNDYIMKMEFNDERMITGTWHTSAIYIYLLITSWQTCTTTDKVYNFTDWKLTGECWLLSNHHNIISNNIIGSKWMFFHNWYGFTEKAQIAISRYLIIILQFHLQQVQLNHNISKYAW